MAPSTPTPPERSRILEVLDRHGLAPGPLGLVGEAYGRRHFSAGGALIRFGVGPDLGPRLAEVPAHPLIPRLRASGRLGPGPEDLYLVVDLLPGDDLEASAPGLADPRPVAEDLSAFLTWLHGHRRPRASIGPYVPLVPDFEGSWREGHRALGAWLAERLGPEGRPALDRLDALAPALAFEAGPRLLHNDLHPRNLLTLGGRLSGVIDWECAQAGEADFDLLHLVHWALFPPNPASAFGPVVVPLLGLQARALGVPRLVERLTIYQLEHELCQVVWAGGRFTDDRLRRLGFWLEGGLARWWASVGLPEDL